MKSILIIAAALCLPSFVVACGGAAPGGSQSTSSASTAAKEGDSCGGFVANPKQCADGLTCVANPSIPDLPGTCQADPSSNQCNQPTDCTGFLPQTCQVCADGSSQCAHWDCNAGQCQTTTCGDNGGSAVTCNDFTTCPSGQICNGSNGGPGVCVSAPSDPNACQSPSDCNGFLPRNCQACADGTTQCAHWDCNAGECQTTTCGDNGGVASSSNPNACQSPSDCTGFLPQNCQACADGSTQCAHWDCNAGSCQTTTCGDNGGVASSSNDCTNAGGSCVALSPGSCASGNIGDANVYSCGGGLGVECCLPN